MLHPSIGPPAILEVCKAGLGNDCPKLAWSGGDTVTCWAITSWECFSRYDERGLRLGQFTFDQILAAARTALGPKFWKKFARQYRNTKAYLAAGVVFVSWSYAKPYRVVSKVDNWRNKNTHHDAENDSQDCEAIVLYRFSSDLVDEQEGCPVPRYETRHREYNVADTKLVQLIPNLLRTAGALLRARPADGSKNDSWIQSKTIEGDLRDVIRICDVTADGREHTSKANHDHEVPKRTLKLSHLPKYAAKSRRVAVGAPVRVMTASGSKNREPLVKNPWISRSACWTFRSMSMVKRGVSEIVRRKYMAATDGMQPSPMRRRHMGSMAAKLEGSSFKSCDLKAVTTMKATIAATVKSESSSAQADRDTYKMSPSLGMRRQLT
jgi:hypothetical protein